MRKALWAVCWSVTAVSFVALQVLSQPPGFEDRPGDHGGGKPPPNPLIQALDLDRNGTIAPQELAQAANSLKKLDQNRDGELTPDELRPRGGRPPGGPHGPGGPGGPPPYELGKVMPPPIEERLELSEKQEQQLRALEKEVRARLLQILTAEQKQQLEQMRRHGPGSGDPNCPRPQGEEDRPGPPPEDEVRHNGTGGIQWFATLDSGLQEARRTGQPILLVSAAPHCAGVSGIW